MPAALKIENSELPKARRFNAIRKDIEGAAEEAKVWYGHASYDRYDINDLMNYHSQIGMMVSKLKTRKEMDAFERTMVAGRCRNRLTSMWISGPESTSSQRS